MVKKLHLAALLIVVSAIFLSGCSLDDRTSSTDSGKTGQVSGIQEANADSPKDGANVEDQYVRSDSGEGGVEVEAIRITPEYLKATGNEELAQNYDLNNNFVFEIVMTAHMGDLTQYKIMEKAELTVDGKVIKPDKWDIVANNPHHPEGFLVFPSGDGSNSNAAKLELDLKQLNGISERKFTW